MTTLAARSRSPLAALLHWLESEVTAGPGRAPTARLEDYFEDGIYVLRAEIPGIDPAKDVEVTVDGDLLTIQGERREETRDKNRRELRYGAFSRTVTLPPRARVDEIAASYADGVVGVKVPVDSRSSTKQHVAINRAENGAV